MARLVDLRAEAPGKGALVAALFAFGALLGVYAVLLAASAGAQAASSGPPAGSSIVVDDNNGNRRVDVGDLLTVVANGDYEASPDASLTVRDADASRSALVNARNARIRPVNGEVQARITGPVEANGGNAIPNARNGVRLVSSTGIREADATPGEQQGADDVQYRQNTAQSGANPPTDGGATPPVPVDEGTSTETDGGTAGENPGANPNGVRAENSGESTVPEESQDEVGGPLSGGAAIGRDVLVPDDLIDVDGDGQVPDFFDGRPITGLDRILIPTEDCRLTGRGDGLTVTLDDQGEPFRIRDGDNVDFTIRQDGTIVANGRERLGATFPPALRNNPKRVIVRIPVEKGQTFSRKPNQTFPVVSSTGIGGKGCRPAGAGQEDAGSSNVSDPRDDVVRDTIPNRPLPNTGGTLAVGTALLGLASLGIGCSAVGFAAWRRRRG